MKEKTLERIFYSSIGVIVACGIASVGMSISSMREASKGPLYLDVNEDGVKDQIEIKAVSGAGILGSISYTPVYTTNYGFTLNDNVIYLPKKEFEKINRH